MESRNIFHYKFSFRNKRYNAEILPCYELSTKEIVSYKVLKNSFFVKLATPGGMKYFELYVAEDLEWYTTLDDPEIPDEIIQILGKYVDDKTA
jgi:hypothetical protein